MRAHWSYLKYVLRHKWYVLIECVRLGIIWQGLWHDWHKFLPSEWFPYARYFHNPDGSPRQIRNETGYYKPTDTVTDGWQPPFYDGPEWLRRQLYGSN